MPLNTAAAEFSSEDLLASLAVINLSGVRVSIGCKQGVTCYLKPTKRSCSQPRPLPPCFLHWLGMFITLGRGQGGSQVREGLLEYHTARLWHCPEPGHRLEDLLSRILWIPHIWCKNGFTAIQRKKHWENEHVEIIGALNPQQISVIGFFLFLTNHPFTPVH